jgi:predicted  nucleic acid-binding Zn-ribbon protein
MSISSSNYQNSQNFLSSIQTLQEQLPPILDDFEKYYVLYNKNPSDTEYQQMFSNIKSNLNNINSQLFTISNNVDSNTQNISKDLLSLNKEIQQLKTQNTNLKKKLNNLKGKNNTSDELIENYKEIYDLDYLKNWGLLLSIVGSGLLLNYIFRNKTVAKYIPSPTITN